MFAMDRIDLDGIDNALIIKELLPEIACYPFFSMCAQVIDLSISDKRLRKKGPATPSV